MQTNYFSANAFAHNGDVLVPVNVAENACEIISLVNMALKVAGYHRVPIHFVSSVVKRSLHLSNVLGEWMSLEYVNKLYEAKYPLIHGQLLADKLLYHHEYPSKVFEYPKPHIILAGHVELQCGEALDFLKTWNLNPNNLLILADWPMDALNNRLYIETLNIFTRSSLNISEIVYRTRPKSFACIDNPYTRSHSDSLPKATYFMPVSCPVKFKPKQEFVMALLTEKSLKSMEVDQSSHFMSPDGNKIYPMVFSGNIMIPSSLKTPNQGVNFVVRVKSNNSQSNNQTKTINCDELINKYSSHLPDILVREVSPNNKIVSWKDDTNNVLIKNINPHELEAVVSSSNPGLMNRLNKILDEYVYEKN